MKNIIICAAKTGGHIFPALGFAKEALKNDYKITFLGTCLLYTSPSPRD